MDFKHTRVSLSTKNISQNMNNAEIIKRSLFIYKMHCVEIMKDRFKCKPRSEQSGSNVELLQKLQTRTASRAKSSRNQVKGKKTDIKVAIQSISCLLQFSQLGHESKVRLSVTRHS